MAHGVIALKSAVVMGGRRFLSTRKYERQYSGSVTTEILGVGAKLFGVAVAIMCHRSAAYGCRPGLILLACDSMRRSQKATYYVCPQNAPITGIKPSSVVPDHLRLGDLRFIVPVLPSCMSTLVICRSLAATIVTFLFYLFILWRE